jgi:putative ABC transport system permease protein
MSILYAAATQSLTFLPLAVGITISYRLLRATDMTLDGSFVVGAAVFARLITLGFSPVSACICALFSGALAGVMVSLIQKGGRVDPLLAGVLATFILTSANLIIMGRPNINLLSQHTLVSDAFIKSDLSGWLQIGMLSAGLCLLSYLLVRTRFGLMLRALGDNPERLKKLGNPLELYRVAGFAFTNTLASAAGILTAQTVGYADVSMGFGMTLTGIGAIILGQQLLAVFVRSATLRALGEFSACFLGVFTYFSAINILLRLDMDPVYLKMMLGLILIVFLRTAVNPNKKKWLA